MHGWFFSGHLAIDDQWPLSSLPLSQLDMEALGVRRSHPGSRACTFGTSRFRYHHLLLLYPANDWRDLPRLLGSCFHSRRPTHRSGREWMPFHFAWVLRLFRSGQRWMAVHPGSGWGPVHSHQGLAEPCLATPLRLPWMESRPGPASLEAVYHWDGHRAP